MARHASLGLLALALAVGATAWAQGDSSQPRDRVVASIVHRAGKCPPGTVVRLGTPGLSFVAVARGRLAAYRKPARRRFARFRRLNVNDVPTVFSIRAAVYDRGCDSTWYRVQLPIRPNGVVGYVRAHAVDVAAVHTRIVVDLSRRRLTYFRSGRAIMHTRVAVGAPATPTPVGRFYVNQRLVPTDPSGPYGPGALGISAFSNVLTGWTQGGPIAIHGTDAPWSIGHAVSNGCIRVRNDVLRRIFRGTFAGTPVIISP